MNDDGWKKFLTQIADATESGKVQWKRTDLRGTYVLARSSGSLTLRHPAKWAQVVGGSYRLELSDADGHLRDELAVAPNAAYLSTANEGQILQQVRRIVAAIKRYEDGTERLADSIIAEIELNDPDE